MIRRRREDVVAEGPSAGITGPGREIQQRRQVGLAPVVEVEIYAPVVEQDEIPRRVDSLDWMAVGVVCFEEEWVVRCD